MKARKRTLVIVLAAALGAAAMLLLGLHQTLHGLLSQKIFAWKEDSFNGRPLSELQTDLTSQGRELVPVDSDSFYAITERTLKPSQRALRFLKGKEYRWFGYGTAVNVGYVVAEKEGEGEKVVAIIRARSVDSL